MFGCCCRSASVSAEPSVDTVAGKPWECGCGAVNSAFESMCEECGECVVEVMHVGPDFVYDPRWHVLWERNCTRGAMTWDEAKQEAANTQLHGFQCQLPSLEQVVTICHVDASSSEEVASVMHSESIASIVMAAAIIVDSRVFPDTPPNRFWTAADAENKAFFVDMSCGDIGEHRPESTRRSYARFLAPVTNDQQLWDLLTKNPDRKEWRTGTRLDPTGSTSARTPRSRFISSSAIE